MGAFEGMMSGADYFRVSNRSLSAHIVAPEGGKSYCGKRYTEPSEGPKGGYDICKSCMKLICADATARDMVVDAEARLAEVRIETEERLSTNVVSAQQNLNENPITTGESDTMADAKTPTLAETNAIIREEVKANTERVRSLAEAENTEGAAELVTETEALIASLPSRERKKLLSALDDASKAQADPKPNVVNPKPEPGTAVANLETEDYTKVEGVSDLVTLGATKVTESVNLHLKTSHTAKEVAAVILDIRRRIHNKDGHPDLTARSDAAKKAASALYQAAGSQLSGDEFEVTEAVKRMTRSVQNQMSDVMAEYLRGLDESPEEAALFEPITKDREEGTTIAQAVAGHYGLKLKGATELAREKYEAAKALGAGADADADSEEGEEGAEGTESAAESADDRIAATVKKIMRNLKAAKPEDFEAASDEAKKEARTQLSDALEAIKAMIAATL